MNTQPLQPDIWFLGVRIQEPVTMLTDILVSLVCIISFFRIRKWNKQENLYRCFQYYFLSMGIATFLGGVMGHGFQYLFSIGWKLPGWLTSMCSITLIERASIEMCAPLLSPVFVRRLRIINVAELLLFIGIVFSTINFKFVEVHSFYGLMVVVASLQFYNYRRTGLTGSRIILYAILVLVGASIVFTAKLAPGTWFNHLDVSHILMTIATGLFFKAVQSLKETEERRPGIGREIFTEGQVFQPQS